MQIIQRLLIYIFPAQHQLLEWIFQLVMITIQKYKCLTAILYAV